VRDLIAGDQSVWAREPMEALVKKDQLRVFIHQGFWHPMDTLRDKTFLEAEWTSGAAKWRVW
jgi:glucose-1-phosphate cytidylyltransferase